ncbi:hypothetical protein ACLOJK_031486 [Asimina triloba]
MSRREGATLETLDIILKSIWMLQLTTWLIEIIDIGGEVELTQRALGNDIADEIREWGIVSKA